jgi:hypothetical protein
LESRGKTRTGVEWIEKFVSVDSKYGYRASFQDKRTVFTRYEQQTCERPTTLDDFNGGFAANCNAVSAADAVPVADYYGLIGHDLDDLTRARRNTALGRRVSGRSREKSTDVPLTRGIAGYRS